MEVAKLTIEMQNTLIQPILKQITVGFEKEQQIDSLSAEHFALKKDVPNELIKALSSLILNEEHTRRLEQALQILLEKGSSPAYRQLIPLIKGAASALQSHLAKKNLAIDNFFSLQEWLKISEEDFAQIYTLASDLFTEGQLQAAADLLLLMTLLNPHLYSVWIALGMAEQKLSSHEQALRAYGFAMLIDFARPQASLYTADCYLQIGDKQLSADFLQLTRQLNETYKDQAVEQQIQQIEHYLIAKK